MKHLFFTVLFVLGSMSALAQKEFSSLEEQMTGKEFTDAGLGKLTPEELRALNAWLRAHSVATLDEARVVQGDTRGFEDSTMSELDGSDISTRVVGSFSGWDGNTVFKLENGMIWKQNESSTFAIEAVENPPVTLERGAFGVWRLSVDGYNRKVKVERIQ